MPPHSQPRPSAERLFAQFLERQEAGDALAFEAWAAGHPAFAPELRLLHRRWQELVAQLDRLSNPPGAAAEGTAP
jgi:hypothetical protein